jgi:mannose-6-phosphate isomerase-like protein (cupin superfamily)
MKRMVKGLVVAVCFTAISVLSGLVVSSQEPAEKTDDSKYGKYILTTELYKKIGHYTGTSLVARDGKLQGDISMCYHCLAKPISFDMTHSHDFEETLCFIGGNPLDITDFDAVIEITIGGEKHVLTKPGCVTIPRGVPHCPITIKNVSPEKPIVFLEISLSSSYGTSKEIKQ